MVFRLKTNLQNAFGQIAIVFLSDLCTICLTIEYRWIIVDIANVDHNGGVVIFAIASCLQAQFILMKIKDFN